MSEQSADQVVCPHCKSSEVWREEVDIGVGTQYGPIHCKACGYDEEEEIESLFRTEELEDESPGEG